MKFAKKLVCSLCFSLACIWHSLPSYAQQAANSPAYALKPGQLAIVVNDEDPNSLAAGEYYRQVHNVPAANLVHVQISGKPHKLDAVRFRQLKQQINRQISPKIQALVLLWTAPYAVECNSITSALTFGYDAAQCKKTCAPGRPSPYFDSESTAPYTDFGFRPAMLLPVETLEQAKALIDRAAIAGFQVVEASAYYVQTSDKARNSRASLFPSAANVPQKKLHIKPMRAEFLEGAQDIIIYQTGAISVPKLETLRFLPGALADHLTSLGGDLLGQSQMSSLR